MKSNGLFISLMVGLFLLATAGFFWLAKGIKSEKSTLPDLVTIKPATDGQEVHLPYARVSLKLPKALFNITDQDLTKYNKTDWDSDLTCGYLSHDTLQNNFFWLSYRLNNGCAFETSFPTLNELSAISDLKNISCNNLTSLVDFAQCKSINDVNTKFNGFTAYKYIPDYLSENSDIGIIAKIYFLRKNADPDKTLVMSLSSNTRISRQDFQTYTNSLSGEPPKSAKSLIDEIDLMYALVNSVTPIM
ncbi:MAG: hypothetical protein WC497_02490 [Patescibacteria group bacterium]